MTTEKWTVTEIRTKDKPCECHTFLSDPLNCTKESSPLPSTSTKPPRTCAMRTARQQHEATMLHGSATADDIDDSDAFRPCAQAKGCHQLSLAGKKTVRIGGNKPLRRPKLTQAREEPKINWKKIRRRLKKTVYSLNEEELNLLYRLYQVKFESSAPQLRVKSYDNLVELFWREANGTFLSVCRLFNMLHVLRKMEKSREQKSTKSTSNPTEKNSKRPSKATTKRGRKQDSLRSASVKNRASAQGRSSPQESDSEESNSRRSCSIS